ncbi:hypothetical protein Hdeb2414_s0197g00830051 [Helianthus debilis subsp. tardiflorus]
MERYTFKGWTLYWYNNSPRESGTSDVSVLVETHQQFKDETKYVNYGKTLGHFEEKFKMAPRSIDGPIV